MSEPLIELHNVSRWYEKNGKANVGVKNINLNIYKGEILAIVGPSGCGKTTILRMIADVIEPTSGSIRYGNHSIGYARTHGLLGYVPQSLSLIPFRTVYENIRLPLEIRQRTDKKRVHDLVTLCGLDGFENYFPSELSGGMKQRTAIARALSINPEVLLMDEPFASLDEMIKEKLNEEVLRFQSVLHTTIVYVTHNIEEAVFLSNRVMILSREPGTITDVVDIDLPEKRDASLRTELSFFRNIIKVRKSMKNS